MREGSIMRGQRFEFSSEQEKYIVDNWGIESVHSMKKRFGCSWDAICRVAKEHGLEIPTSNAWSEEEVELLKKLAPEMDYQDIAVIMGRTYNAIMLKAKKLGIQVKINNRRWTKDEEQLFKDLWGNVSIEYLAKKMNRSIYALKVKAIRMGLGSMISNNYDIILVSDLVDLLKVTKDRIVQTWPKHVLNLQQKRLTKNRVYYYVTWKDLMIFLENNQNEWDSRNVEVNMLGSEPDWLQDKRVRDLKENPLFYRYWTEDEINKAIDLFNSGKSYEEIATIINRSEMAVKYTLRQNGYSYMLPQHWKGYEFKYLKDNYLTMTYQEIAEHLGRSTKAVAAKAEELGYKKRDMIRSRKKENKNG